MNHVHALVLLSAFFSGSFGLFMLVCFVWFPIAASWKLEVEVCRPVREAVNVNTQHINIEGAIVKVHRTTDSTGEMAVGMSMGEG